MLERLVPIAKEVRTDEGDWYIRRILPYRTEDNRIDGTVITFTDISDRSTIGTPRAGSAAVCRGNRRDGAPPIGGSGRRPARANRAIARSTTSSWLSPEDTQGQLFYELGNRQWDIPALRTLLEEMLPQQGRHQAESLTRQFLGAVVDHEVNHDFEQSGRRTMLLNARAIES